MKIHIGPIPESADFDVSAGWSPVREPSPRKLLLIAIPVAAVMSVLFGGFWASRLDLSRHEVLFPYPPLLLACFFLLLIAAHELLHAAVFPGFPRSERCLVGVWPKRLLFFAHYDGQITRTRFLLSTAMPLIVLSTLPIILALAFALQTRLWAAVSTWNAMVASLDIIGIRLALLEIPRGAMIRNQGWKTFWKT